MSIALFTSLIFGTSLLAGFLGALVARQNSISTSNLGLVESVEKGLRINIDNPVFSSQL